MVGTRAFNVELFTVEKQAGLAQRRSRLSRLKLRSRQCWCKNVQGRAIEGREAGRVGAKAFKVELFKVE